jgi:hypothetical protein
MQFFGELDGDGKPFESDPLVGGQALGPKSGLGQGAGTDSAGRLHQNKAINTLRKMRIEPASGHAMRRYARC